MASDRAPSFDWKGELEIATHHTKGLGLELIEAIPLPDKDVPLNEILEFKLKRNDEFVALRTELDSIGSALNSAENSASELQRAVGHIDKVGPSIANDSPGLPNRYLVSGGLIPTNR